MEHSRKRWWKSAFKLGTGNKVSKSDMKKMRARLPADDSDLFQDQLTVVKIIGEKSVIYCGQEDEPLFFQFQQNGDLFPTVYAMWRNPKLLPLISISKMAWESIERGEKGKKKKFFV